MEYVRFAEGGEVWQHPECALRTVMVWDSDKGRFAPVLWHPRKAQLLLHGNVDKFARKPRLFAHSLARSEPCILNCGTPTDEVWGDLSLIARAANAALPPGSVGAQFSLRTHKGSSAPPPKAFRLHEPRPDRARWPMKALHRPHNIERYDEDRNAPKNVTTTDEVSCCASKSP